MQNTYFNDIMVPKMDTTRETCVYSEMILG